MDKSEIAMLPADGYGVAYITAANPGPRPDDYQFRGVVKEAEGLGFFERSAWRYRITVLRLDEGDTDVDIDVYVLDENIRDSQGPAIGGDIRGVLWLQGFVSR